MTPVARPCPHRARGALRRAAPWPSAEALVAGALNDALRWLIAAGIRRLGLPLAIWHRVRMRTAARRQRRLFRRFGLTAAPPVAGWGPAVEDVLRARAGPGARAALTSGTTARPKSVPYSPARLRAVKRAYIDMFIRACRARRIRRTSLFVFGSLDETRSLTSLLLAERGRPPYLSTLQAPYRVLRDPPVGAIASAYGGTAVRLWVLTLANPGVLYATNPSTLATFFADLAEDWMGHSRLAREFSAAPWAFDPAVRAVARRLWSRGAAHRLAAVAASATPLPLHVFAPAVEAYICWTGGYVGPFLERLAIHLPRARYQLIPMFSMSTETIETVPHFDAQDVRFLPIAPGVCYEFVDEREDPVASGSLLTPDQLEVGRTYSMIVSDRHGLRRYDTGDIFRCRGFVEVGRWTGARLPDLEFVRRCGLAYSFTGEKLTAGHVACAFDRLRAGAPWIGSGAFLTCVPSWPPHEPVPHYKVILARRDGCDPPLGPRHDHELAARCDRLFGEINPEYWAKRNDRRLGAVQVVRLPWADYRARVAGGGSLVDDSQAKELPLVPVLWETLEGRGGSASRSST